MKPTRSQTVKKYAELINKVKNDKVEFTMEEGRRMASVYKVDQAFFYIMKYLKMLTANNGKYMVNQNLYVEHAAKRIIEWRAKTWTSKVTVKKPKQPATSKLAMTAKFDESLFAEVVKIARSHGWTVTAYKETRIEI